MSDPAATPPEFGLRQDWRPGVVSLGGWCSIGNSFSAELMGRSGFDWVCIDQQHGLVGPDVLVSMVQALSLTRTPALVRVPAGDAAWIMRVLDTGAQGVIVPLVNTAADAAVAVDAARYPPDGSRSWGPIRPLQDVRGYSPKLGNARTLVIVQIETLQAIENLDAILSVPGVDGVFVGPNDLALSGGWTPTLTPDVDEHRDLILRVVERAHAHSSVAGVYCGSVAMAEVWRRAGFDMLAVTSDAILIKSGAVAAVGDLRREAAE